MANAGPARAANLPDPSRRVVIFDESTLPDPEGLRAALADGLVVVITSSGVDSPVMRKADSVPPLRAGSLAVHVGARRVVCNERDVPLTDREISILQAFVSRSGQALSFDELSVAGWGVETYGHPDVVRSAIKRLRRKLTLVHAGVAIEAVRGFGFRLSERATKLRPVAMNAEQNGYASS